MEHESLVNIWRPICPVGGVPVSISITSNTEGLTSFLVSAGWSLVFLFPFTDQNTEAQGSHGISQGHRTHNWLLRALWEPEEKCRCGRPPRGAPVRGFLSLFFLSVEHEGREQSQSLSKVRNPESSVQSMREPIRRQGSTEGGPS